MKNDQAFSKVVKYVKKNYKLDESYEIPTYTNGDKIVALMPSENIISVAFNADGIFGVGKFGFIDIINGETKAEEIYKSLRKTNSLYMITGETGNLHMHNNKLIFTNYLFKEELKVKDNPFYDRSFERFRTQAIVKIKNIENTILVSDWNDQNLLSERIFEIETADDHRKYSYKVTNMYYDIEINPKTLAIQKVLVKDMEKQR